MSKKEQIKNHVTDLMLSPQAFSDVSVRISGFLRDRAEETKREMEEIGDEASHEAFKKASEEFYVYAWTLKACTLFLDNYADERDQERLSITTPRGLSN